MPRARLLAAAALALCLIPTAARADHAAAGDCLHAHPEATDPRRCVLTPPAPDEPTACTIEGRAGTCVQRGKDCRCETDQDVSQRQNLVLMATNLQVLLPLLVLKRQIGLPLICAQFGVLVPELTAAEQAILALGALRFYEPRLLGKLDFLLANWERVGKFGVKKCGLAIDVGGVFAGLLLLKQQMLAAFPLLLVIQPPVPTPAVSPSCSVGDFAAVDQEQFTKTAGSCDVESLTIRSNVCPLLVPDLGFHGMARFPLKQGTTDVGEADGIFVNQEPDHHCELVLGSGPALTLSCSRPGGGCTATYAATP